ncbi:glutaredoxin-C6-like [Telopea speciosissima]|uniref:glutaredoxin-C6-like n=1 Tax=Telopea speciosissima TaxID=54955 RepID=UPI001CC7E8D3|nr:glutaredoxin-C6-like [Telopea speciosissima]
MQGVRILSEGGVRVDIASPAGEGTATTRVGAAPLTIDVGETPERMIERLITENPVIIFSRKSCCMCHVMKKLLSKIDVHPVVIELEESELGALAAHDSQDQAQVQAQGQNEGGIALADPAPAPAPTPTPAVFIGGKRVGGLKSLMALHLSGELVAMLRDVGAIWMSY